jgi:hypothetical protein
MTFVLIRIACVAKKNSNREDLQDHEIGFAVFGGP